MERNDLEALGRRLTNREIYNYFKECIVAKSNKMAEIIRTNCLTVEFTEGLEESALGIFRKIAQFSKNGI